MLVATFGPTTAWVGRSITYEYGQLILDGHGPITAQTVLEYDRQGHLLWAREGLREWVQQVARPTQRRKPFPVWAIVLIVAVPVVFVVPIIAAIAIPMFAAQHNLANESAVKEGVHSIQVGVQSWAVDNGDRYPDPALVSPSGLGRYVDDWPVNPYTGRPMTQGNGQGDFNYAVSLDHMSFEVVGNGYEGTPVITVP